MAARARAAPSPTATRVASAGTRRKTTAAGERQLLAQGAATTAGAMAAASRITIGPVLGSVPDPEKTLPKRPWPDIHMTKANTAPAKSQGPARRASSGARPTTSEAAARIQAHCVPVEVNWFEMLVSTCPYQPGWLGTMPTMALCTDVDVRLFGRRNRTAASDQYPAHTTRGVTERPMPCAAAEDATPTRPEPGSGSSSWPRPCRGDRDRDGDRGQAMRPSSPYMSTEPGAPVSADAVPVRSMPMPSPTNQTPRTHTKDRTSAGRTVRRKSRPNAMAT